MADPVIWGLVISSAVSVGTGIDASNKQKAAARDQKDQQAQQRNQQAAEDTVNRRAAIRDERVRRAQILQSAQNAGAAGSSGEANSISNLSSSIGANLSGIAGGAQTNDQMTARADQIQSNIDSAAQSLAIGKTVSGFLDSAGQGIKDSQAKKYDKDGNLREEYKPTTVSQSR